MRFTTIIVAVLALGLLAPPSIAAAGDVLQGPEERESTLRPELDAAKEEGNLKAAERIERELAALRGLPFEFISNVPADLGLRVETGTGEAALAKERWVDDDILVAGMGGSEVRPSMASDEAGNLYVAVEWHYSSGTMIWIYKSENGGMYWESWFMLSALEALTKPSIAVGEGGEDWLLLVCQYGDTHILLTRIALVDPAQYDGEVIESNVIGVSNPRIVTDAAEWAGWYPYVVWNSKGVDNWVLRFSRSLDYGATWQAPTTLTGYCGYPDEFYDGTEAYPDIDYGSRRLYVAFDNYSPPCTSTGRDVFAMQSADYGATWAAAIRLTSETDDEYGPRVGAVKNYLDEPTAVVAYTRFWHDVDNDIMYHGTEDGGASWSTHLCMSCTPDTEEIAPDVEASFSQGRIHAAWWEADNIYYRSAPYTSPLAWGSILRISDSDAADVAFPRPTVAVNPTASPLNEVGIAWADFRWTPAADDVFYDGASGNPTGVSENEGIPSVTLLEPVQPNPFNPAALLRFSLSAPGAVHLAVHDVAGRRVAVLADGHRGAGSYEAVWNGLDDSGRKVPSGVYFARLHAGEYTATRKMVLLK
jgi:hypothetical protein